MTDQPKPDTIRVNLQLDLPPGDATEELIGRLERVARAAHGRLGRTEYETVGSYMRLIRRKTLVGKGAR